MPKETKKMVADKKRVEAKVIEKSTAKKRPSKIEESIVVPEPIIEPEPVKQKRTRVETSKYVKISTAESSLKFKEIGDRVQKKELKWAFYEGDGAIGYHYYRIIGTQDL